MPSRQRRLLLWACLLLLSGGAASFTRAAELGDAAAVPQLGARGIESYRAFLDAGNHRAFAVAPGGAWAWRADLPSAGMAEQAALADCREHTAATCVPYAIDDRVVFDAKAWPTLWGPYATADAAKRAPVGTRRGERFPDLVFRDAGGRATKVSDFRGKVLVLHFWGSWCGPCRRELPDLQALVRRMGRERDVRFAFLPVREPFEVARTWARTQKFQLPLFDAGEKEFVLASGERLPDRQIAGKFPATYVLDKHGLVIFSHVGDAGRWPEYAPFLADAARRSGR
jgi:thiol-disulfide isomerase/thioredoxin